MSGRHLASTHQRRAPYHRSASSVRRPLHPILCHVPFTREGWLYELKHDGFRALARTGSDAKLLSRSGRSMAEPFPEIVAVLKRLPGGLMLDGELVVPGADGRSDFEEVRAET